MKKILATGLATATILSGSLAVSAVAPVAFAGAQEDSTSVEEHADGRIGTGLGNLLERLVNEGVISAEQSETISNAVQEERAERQSDRQARRDARRAALAEILGISVEDLTSQLESGATVADIAGEDVDNVIAALVAEATERIEAKVADDTITQEMADQKLEGLEDKITARVNGERPERGERGPRGGGRPGGGAPQHDVEV